MGAGVAQWERLGFVLLFSAAWRWCVLEALGWMQFSTHLHPWETALFQLVPVTVVPLVRRVLAR